MENNPGEAILYPVLAKDLVPAKEFIGLGN